MIFLNMVNKTAQKPNERDVWVKGLSHLVIDSLQSSYLVQEHRLFYFKFCLGYLLFI